MDVLLKNFMSARKIIKLYPQKNQGNNCKKSNWTDNITFPDEIEASVCFVYILVICVLLHIDLLTQYNSTIINLFM